MLIGRCVFALLALFTVALTSTVPKACAGTVAVQVVLDVQVTGFALVVPNLETVAVAPTAKQPVPVMVTVVPADQRSLALGCWGPAEQRRLKSRRDRQRPTSTAYDEVGRPFQFGASGRSARAAAGRCRW